MAVVEFILIAFVVPIVSSKSIFGQSYVTPNDTQTCANDLVAWCEGVKYPTEEGGVSIVSVTVYDSNTGYCQGVCTATSNSTDCTKNGSPWFSCSNKNQLLYKGNALTKDSLEGTDDDTCMTASAAFNDLNVQYLNSNSTSSMQNDLEQYFRQFNEQLWRKFYDLFGDGYPFYYPGLPVTPNTSDDDTNTPTDEDNRETE